MSVLNAAARAALSAGRLAHVVTVNADGTPQVSLVWTGIDGDDIVGVIDFDTASPGPRVWDLAYTAYRFVPLTDPANPDVPFPGIEQQRRRLALFCSAYALDRIRPADVLETAVGDRAGCRP